jgi:hypothetical protein
MANRLISKTVAPLSVRGGMIIRGDGEAPLFRTHSSEIGF